MDLRGKFEKTKIFNQVYGMTLDFDENSQRYFSLHPVYMLDSIAINAAWLMFQEQQSKMDAVLNYINHEEWSMSMGIINVLHLELRSF